MDEMLYSLQQVAQFSGRSYDTVRTYYTFPGFLPDPLHTVKHGKKTTRLFTLEEMEKMKIILNGIEWGGIAKYTRGRRMKRHTDA